MIKIFKRGIGYFIFKIQRYEIYQITKEIVKEPKVINSFYPEDHYLEPAALPEKWNDFKTLF